MGRAKNVYALYDGEEIEAWGTLKQIASLTGLKESTLRFYAKQAYKDLCEERSERGRALVCVGTVGDGVEG